MTISAAIAKLYLVRIKINRWICPMTFLNASATDSARNAGIAAFVLRPATGSYFLVHGLI